MKVTIPQPQLLQSLELLGRISTKNATLPVLQCVRIKTNKNELVLEATNLEISAHIPISCEVEEEGEVAVPSQILIQNIQLLSEKEITLSTNEQTLMIETKTAHTTIKTHAIDEFPNIQKITDNGIELSGKSFAYGIKSVAFAASSTSIKPELGSVFIQQKKEHSLTFVATDSFRLMEKTVSQKNVVLEQTLMVPNKNAIELARVCESLDEEPKLIVNDNQCALLFPNGVYMASRLVTGSFPDYEQIIPKEYSVHAFVLKEELSNAFKKTNIFLNKFRQVTISVSDKDMTVSANNNDIGHTTDTIQAEVDGEELTLSFNQQYLMDPLAHIQDDSLKLSFAGIGRAMVMQGKNDKSLRYLVMPMNK